MQYLNQPNDKTYQNLTSQHIKFLPLKIWNNFTTTGDHFQDRTAKETDKLFNKYLISAGIFLNIKQKTHILQWENKFGKAAFYT